MRQLIEKRLDFIKDHHSGFPKATMRWSHFFVPHDNNKRHISQVEWDELDDEELLSLYERIVRQMNKQM